MRGQGRKGSFCEEISGTCVRGFDFFSKCPELSWSCPGRALAGFTAFFFFFSFFFRVFVSSRFCILVRFFSVIKSRVTDSSSGNFFFIHVGI